MADDTDGGNLRLGSRLLAIIAVGILAYVSLLLVSHVVGTINPAYWKGLDVAAAIVVGYFAALLFGSAIRIYLKRVGNLGHVAAIRFVTNVVIAMIVVAVILSLFNVSLSSLLLSSAFAGIVIGLAAQTVLANVFAGFLIILATPFHVGDRIAVVSSNYGVVAPSYPHELGYPTYVGTVRAIGLSYTRLRLDSGRVAEFPNQVLVSALVLNLSHPSPRMYRIRMTLDLKVPVAAVETALSDYVRQHAPIPGVPEPRVEVTDVGVATWDAVVVIWSNDPDEGPLRDAVLRRVLPKLAPGPPAPTAKA
jgi:small conductance mechanosensitive channel